ELAGHVISPVLGVLFNNGRLRGRGHRCILLVVFNRSRIPYTLQRMVSRDLLRLIQSSRLCGGLCVPPRWRVAGYSPSEHSSSSAPRLRGSADASLPLAPVRRPSDGR